MSGRRWMLLGMLTMFLAACSTLRGGGPITTMAPPPALGPAPVVIPVNPWQLVTMAPGPEVLDAAHLQFIENLDNYVQGSARALATYPGSTGPLIVLAWDETDPEAGILTCITSASPSAEPIGGWGCGSRGDARPFSYSSYGQVEGKGTNEFIVQHSPDAAATVIELDDRSTIVIRPGNSTISIHRWDGPRPVRFTMFWNNGTTTSEVVAIP